MTREPLVSLIWDHVEALNKLIRAAGNAGLTVEIGEDERRSLTAANTVPIHRYVARITRVT